jgi:gliding motility-associated-like protein
MDTLKSNFGCDSVYLRNILNIKPIARLASEIRDTFCDEIFINNQIHKSSFLYTDTVRTKDNLKCDSIYQPRNVTIIKTHELSISSSRGLNVEKGEKVVLTSSAAKNYLWNTGESSNRIEFKLTESTTYYVIGWNEELCKDTASIFLTAEDPARLEFPNAFAPFSDSFSNRIFRPNYFGNIELIKFEIYNRIGELMFSASELNNAWWDGIYRGVLQPAGTYSYVIDYRANHIRKFKTGGLMLLR